MLTEPNDAPDEIVLDPDPVVEAYKRDIDRTLLRESLKKTAEERVLALTALYRLAAEARRAGGRAAVEPYDPLAGVPHTPRPR